MNIPFLPKTNIVEGTKYIDYLGIIWEYDKETNNFRQTGIVQTLPEVNEEQDGLVTPAVQTEINELKEKFGPTLTNLPAFFKLSPITDVYYYILKSSNNTVNFIIEGDESLRLEINIHEILRHFISMARKGDRGDVGDRGDPGYDAIPDAVICGEPTHNITSRFSSFTEKQIVIKIPVKNINGEDISLRLFSVRPPEYTDDGVIISADVPVDGTSPTQLKSTSLSFKLNPNSSAIYADGYLTATINLLSGSFNDRWYFRALQRGEKGDPGTAGKSYVNVIKTVLPPRISYAQPVIELRVDELRDAIAFTRSEIPNAQCISRITVPGIPDIAPDHPYKSNLLAVEKTFSSCKRFRRWKLEDETNVRATLELPQWTPIAGCQVGDFYNEYNFDWIGYSDIESTNGVWATPDGTRSIKYPWVIMNSDRPAEQDCNPCTDGTA